MVLPISNIIKMRPIILFLIITSIQIQVSAQKASIREEKVTMKTYMFSDPDPVPDMNKNYPYFRFDGFTNEATEKEWKMVIMENDYVKVYITPEIGGKIWGAIEKSTGGEFLYFNDVVKFRDVAHRGPWTSGGLEYNFGIMSHVSTCSTPQDYVLSENPDGSVSCTIGAIDLHTRTRWNVEVLLPADKAFVKTTAHWFNTHNVPVSFYHYMNAAAKTQGNLEFIYPGSHYVGHAGDVGGWPIDNERDISFYENNNFGSYKSYHVLNAYSSHMGGYWHDDDFGFGHLVDHSDMPGKKLWIWGLSEQGMIWVDLLTDTKGQYIEFQSGKSFNQAMTRSSMTPFKHTEFTPYDSDVTTELWFPIKETGGMVAASEYGVLNVKKEKEHIEIILSALQPLDTELKVISDGNTVAQAEVDLQPLELLDTKVEIDPSSDFIIKLGDELLYYSSKIEDQIVERPLYPNDEFDWNSALGLYTKGLELEKQQSYISEGNANMNAHELYLQSLEKDPAFAPALNRAALSYYRRFEYDKALDYIKRSLAIDTYDPLANYLYGLINIKLNDIPDAKSGFSIASQSPAYRSAAFTELAAAFFREGNSRKALAFANDAIAYNQYNLVALEIKALVFRQKGEDEKLMAILDRIFEYDRTSPFATYLKCIMNSGDFSELQQLVTNELPHETYLELAERFLDLGLKDESVSILKMAPEQATVFLWLAFLDLENGKIWLEKGLEASAELVFPYRDVTLEILESHRRLSDHWKLKYYSSLIYWKKGRLEKARELMKLCGDEPDFVPFYLAKAELFNDHDAVRRNALARAKSLEPENWRVNLELIEQYLADRKYQNAADLAGETLKDNPERSVLGLNYAIALLNLGEYRKCVRFLDSFEVIPFEGATMGRNVYHDAAVRAAVEELKTGKYKNAISYAEKALLWPLNLGSGKPYKTDERMEHFIMAYSNKKMGNTSRAEEMFSKVIEYDPRDGSSENSLMYLEVLALREIQGESEAKEFLESSLEKDPGNEYIKWMTLVEKGESAVTGTEEMLLAERRTSPINNSFILLYELLSVIE